VVKGFLQNNVDFDDCFAPVSKQDSLRVLLAMAAAENLEIDQVDFTSAFLQAPLEDDVWIEQPEGYAVDIPGIKIKLARAVYGLRNSPRAFYRKMRAEFEKMGFTASDADPGLFYYSPPNSKSVRDRTFILVHVDDCLIVGERERVDKVKKQLAAAFEIKDMGNAGHYLGMNISRDRLAGTLKLDQTSYIISVLDRFKVSNPTRPRNVPLATGTRLSKTEGEPLPPELSKVYKEIVGSLLYLSVCTRPDMAQSVGMLCRYMATPTSFHMAAARNVLVYLAGTRTLGLNYGRQTPDTTLVGFSDSDYAGDVDNRRSTTGFVFVMNGAVVAWSSRLQHTVATSTTEAEYMAACYACKAAMWERKLLGDLGIPSRGPLLIMGDNQACLKLVGNPIESARSKHIDVQYHYTREQAAMGHIVYRYISTDHMVADIMTKPLDVAKFSYCCKEMGVV
jgi:hypothetical protein